MWNAIRHRDVFGAVGSTSGGLDIRPFPTNWKMQNQLGEFASNKKRWDEHTVINLNPLAQRRRPGYHHRLRGRRLLPRGQPPGPPIAARPQHQARLHRATRGSQQCLLEQLHRTTSCSSSTNSSHSPKSRRNNSPAGHRGGCQNTYSQRAIDELNDCLTYYKTKLLWL